MDESCRVCSGNTAHFGTATVLESVKATFRRCRSCGLIMAVDPSWLADAYADPITALDIGLLDRCQVLSNVTSGVLRAGRWTGESCLDWAGGYGTLTRLMRDRGFDFQHEDPLTKNMFAVGHEATEASRAARYGLVTAFEVLEHLADPVEVLTPVAARAERLLATTMVLPEPAPLPDQWWYYTLETGQHITFYTQRSLRLLAERLGFGHSVTSANVHFFSREPVPAAVRLVVRRPGLAYAAGWTTSVLDRRRSLLGDDLAAARVSLAVRRSRKEN